MTINFEVFVFWFLSKMHFVNWFQTIRNSVNEKFLTNKIGNFEVYSDWFIDDVPYFHIHIVKKIQTTLRKQNMRIHSIYHNLGKISSFKIHKCCNVLHKKQWNRWWIIQCLSFSRLQYLKNWPSSCDTNSKYDSFALKNIEYFSGSQWPWQGCHIEVVMEIVQRNLIGSISIYDWAMSVGSKYIDKVYLLVNETKLIMILVVTETHLYSKKY